MEMKLIEVALALVVIYLVLALAATQLTEMWSAGFGHRPKTLKSMLDEIFQRNDELIRRFLKYPPILALSEGARMPSAIPPQLFATAFLAVVNGDKPPRDEHRTPARFIAELAAGKQNRELVQLLRFHAAGAANWNAMEASLARWYSDICDRAEGWYKRTSSKTILWIAAALVLAANADTVYIARSLMENDALRVALANIGELIADQKADDEARAAGLTPAVRQKLVGAGAGVRPFDVSAELDRALGEIRSASNLVPQLFAFGDDKGEIARTCAYGRDVENSHGGGTSQAAANGATGTRPPDPSRQLYDSNFDAWSVLLPYIFNRVEQASLGIAAGRPDNLASGSERATVVRQTMLCTTAIAAWLRAAQYSTKNKDAQAHLKEASAALERARERMQALIGMTTFQSSLLRSYAALGPVFSDCASEAGNSRAAFDKCLAAAQVNSIPLGWPSRGDQFCRLSVVPKPLASPEREPVCTETVVAMSNCPVGMPSDEKCIKTSVQTICKPAPGGQAGSQATAPGGQPGALAALFSSLGGCRDFAGNVNLELPAIQAQVEPARVLGGLFGLFITTVMVSLGGPFWYGVLSKVATLRMAGRVRGLDTPPASHDEKSRKADEAAGDADNGAAAPFDHAVNVFERALTPQEISRLQIALHMTPTMVLDEPTRDKIADRLGKLGQTPVRYLSATTYFLIVGREAGQAADVRAASPIRAMADFGTDQLKALLDALNQMFPADAKDDWTPLADSDSFDALRARLTLFRYKSDPKTLPHEKVVASLATNDPEALTRLDASVLQQVMEQAKLKSQYHREDKRWMDFAYGELGVREIPGADDNVRVVEYLTAIGGKTHATDETSWCGAFAGWVLEQAGMLDKLLATQQGSVKVSKLDLRTAKCWCSLGNERTTGDPQPGDICVVQTGKDKGATYHVAFVAEYDSQLKRPWVIGGNQGGVGGVTLVRYAPTGQTFRYFDISAAVPPISAAPASIPAATNATGHTPPPRATQVPSPGTDKGRKKIRRAAATAAPAATPAPTPTPTPTPTPVVTPPPTTAP